MSRSRPNRYRLSSPARLIGVLAPLFLVLIAAPARTQDPPALANETARAIAADESGRPAGRLTLAIQERRGAYLEDEKLPDTRKRIAAEKPLLAEGSFLYSRDGWVKDLVVTSGAAGSPPTRTRTGEAGGFLRILVETSLEGQPRKLGRVSPVAVTAPGDAVLARRVGLLLSGAGKEAIRWTAGRREADLLTLQGERANERHTLLVREKPRARIASWTLTRALTGPSGEPLAQTYLCEVTPGEGPGSLARVEEWVINPPPAGSIAYRITDIKKEEVAEVRPDDLPVRFPKGTLVSDARYEVPVEYEQTEQGINDGNVADAARTLATGRTRPGAAAPTFELKDPKGKPVRYADYRGKVLVLFWFSSGSRPAEAAAEAIREMHEAYRKNGAQFLGVSVMDEGDAGRKAEAFRKRFKWSFPVAVDASGDTMHRYGLEAGIPKVAIVDRNGTLVYAQPGVDPDGIEAVLNRLTRRE
jgi:peroxiredoxin